MRQRATVQALVAVLMTGVLAVACDDDPSPPKVDARPVDAGSDARDAARDSSTPEMGGTDAGTADRPDGAASDAPASDAPATDAIAPDGLASDAPAIDAPAIDAPAIDATPDTASVDSSVDGAADDGGTDGGDGGGSTSGVACSGGVSREMVCSNYCQAITFFCSGASAQFPSAAACLEACNAPTWACGMLGQPTGNSLFCRVSQLAGAITAAPVACPNAGPNSPVCR